MTYTRQRLGDKRMMRLPWRQWPENESFRRSDLSKQGAEAGSLQALVISTKRLRLGTR